jgi:hypothetical protein
MYPRRPKPVHCSGLTNTNQNSTYPMKTFKVLVISGLLFFSISGGVKLQAQEMLEIPENFSEFLPMFLETYHANDPYIFLFLAPEIGFYTAYNPGASCTAEKFDGAGYPWCTSTEEGVPCRQVDAAIPYNMFNTVPTGSFCEGYPGVASGYYYAPSTIQDLPSFTLGFNDDGEAIYGGIIIPAELGDAEIMKVTVISGEYHSCYLYFIKIEGGWYFICQNFCDCSA